MIPAQPRLNRSGALVIALVAPGIFLGLFTSPASAQQPAVDETLDSATRLLWKATLVHPNGMHNLLLRSLRQMEDPELAPLFADLVNKQHPVLKIHGILGLAEISKDKQIDLKQISDVKDAATRATLVQSAIEGEVLSTAQAQTLMGWKDLDPAAKLLLATKLLSDGQLKDASFIEEAKKHEKVQVRAMAAMVRMQLGEAGALADMKRLDGENMVNREAVRGLLLQTAQTYKLDKVGPWAFALTQEKDLGVAIWFSAMRVALKYKVNGASNVWRERYAATDSIAEKTRLAVLALDQATVIDPSAFDLLLKSDQTLIQQAGRLGATLAKGQDPLKEIDRLIAENNLLSGQWVMQYAQEQKPAAARPILIAVIRAAEGEPNPARLRAQRLENTVMAAQHLAEKDPDPAGTLGPLLNEAPPYTQEAILVGLLRSKHPKPWSLIQSVTPWKTEVAESMALIIKARQGLPVTKEEMEKLALNVRGGGGLQDPLRIQAAWVYLKMKKQHQAALKNAISGK